MRTARPRVYAAHPIAAYGTEHAAARLALLREALPEAEIVDPAEQGWAGSDDWRAEWPSLLEGLTAVVVFAAADRTVGLGCVTEVLDALAIGLPLAGLDGSGLRRLEGLRFVPPPRRTWKRMARLLLGPGVDGRSFPGGRRAS